MTARFGSALPKCPLKHSADPMNMPCCLCLPFDQAAERHSQGQSSIGRLLNLSSASFFPPSGMNYLAFSGEVLQTILAQHLRSGGGPRMQGLRHQAVQFHRTVCDWLRPPTIARLLATPTSLSVSTSLPFPGTAIHPATTHTPATRVRPNAIHTTAIPRQTTPIARSSA